MPVLALIYERLVWGEPVRAALRKRSWLYGSLGAVCVLGGGYIALSLARQGLGFLRGGLQVSRGDYLASQCVAIPTYLGLAVWPAELCIDRGRPPMSAASIVAGGLLVGTLLVATSWGIARRRPWSLLGALFFLDLVMSSSFIPRDDPIVEHRVYVPLLAVVAGVVLAAREVLPRLIDRFAAPLRRRQLRAWAPWVAFVGVTLALVIRTRARNEDYASSLATWERTVAQAPWNARAHHNLGRAYKELGRNAESLVHETRAVELEPDYADAVVAKGNLLAYAGDHARAVAEFTRVASGRGPIAATALYNRARSYGAMGRVAEALRDHEDAIARAPRFAEPRFGRAALLAELGRRREAIEEYGRFLELRPEHVPAYVNRAACWIDEGEFARAVADCDRALALSPDRPDALLNRASARFQLGQHDLVWEDVKAARRYDQHPPPAFLDALRKATGRSE